MPTFVPLAWSLQPHQHICIWDNQQRPAWEGREWEKKRAFHGWSPYKPESIIMAKEKGTLLPSQMNQLGQNVYFPSFRGPLLSIRIWWPRDDGGRKKIVGKLLLCRSTDQKNTPFKGGRKRGILPPCCETRALVCFSCEVPVFFTCGWSAAHTKHRALKS